MKITLGLILAIMLTGLGGAYWWYREVSFREQREKSQINCLTAILLNDTKGEDPENIGSAQEMIADAVVRYGRQNSSLGFCDIHRQGLTLYPSKWDRAASWTGRSSVITGLNPGNWGSAWNEAKNRALLAIERGPAKDRCATRYIRAKPGYTLFTNELPAQEAIRNTMKPDKPVPNLKVKFFCAQ